MSNEAQTPEVTEPKDMNTVSQDGRISICLTSGPVRIKEKDWPLAAEIILPLYRENEQLKKRNLPLKEAIRESIEGEQFPPYEYDAILILCILHVFIRKHADGRHMIYGVREKNWEKGKSLADELGGEVIPDYKEFVPTLNRCAKEFINSCGGGAPDSVKCLIEECLANVNAEYIDEETPLKADASVVVLTGGKSLKISPEVWPIISEARENINYASYRGADGMFEDDFSLKPFGHERLVVRQHKTARTLVYGYIRFDNRWAARFNIFNPRGGELLPAGADILSAIKRVGKSLELSIETIRTCINGLPAQDLD